MDNTERVTKACACANVALVKYWGKRDPEANLPAVGSISLMLEGLEAEATISMRPADRFTSRGKTVPGRAYDQMVSFLDWVARTYDSETPLAVNIETNFPVAAGLASSAAIYCATATAALSFLEVSASRRELSAIARRGSGSASRSVFGGLVEWHRGTDPGGDDSFADPLLPAEDWALGMVVAILDEGQKKTSSRDAMQHVAETSPLYSGWLAAQEDDLESMRHAIHARDFPTVGRITEESTLRMHAVTMAARPAVLYWQPATLHVMEAVRELRATGLDAYFTMDAGPQVKVLCQQQDMGAVAAKLESVPAVLRVLQARAGSGVRVLEGKAPWK